MNKVELALVLHTQHLSQLYRKYVWPDQLIAALLVVWIMVVENAIFKGHPISFIIYII